MLEEFDQTEGKVSIASMTAHLVETPVSGVWLLEKQIKAG